MPQHIPCDNVFSSDRENRLISLLRVQGRVVVDSVYKRIDPSVSFWLKSRIVVCINSFPNFQPLNQKIDSSSVLTIYCCISTAIKGDSVMNNLPIIFGLCIGKTKSCIHIAFTNNMRHSKMVTLNHHLVFVTKG